MRTIGSCILILALVFVFAGASYAKTGTDMKASPLFKASLQQTIERLEGKVEESDAAETPTGKGVCPMGGVTQGGTCVETCEPTLCGGYCYTSQTTCQSPTACLSTCQGQPTCSSTCASTCANTCAGGYCPFHYIWRGVNYWHRYGQQGSNWYAMGKFHCWWYTSTEILFLGGNPPPSELGYWSPWDGFYNIDKWYHSGIPNTYITRSHVVVKEFCEDYQWTDYQAEVTSLSPPNDSGIYLNLNYYFD
jgi:hypothetical protein